MYRQTFSNSNLIESTFDGFCFLGRDFTNAELEKASFKGSSFWIQLKWKFLLTVTILLLAILSSCVIGAGSLFSVCLLIGFSQPIHGIPILLSLSVSLLVIPQRGFTLGVITGVTLLIPFLLLSSVFPTINNNDIGIGVPFFIGVGSVTLVTSGIALATLSTVLALIVFKSVYITITATIGITLAIATLTSRTYTVIPITTIAALFTGYLAWKTINSSQLFMWILQTAIAIAAKRGNLFINANLSGADFTDATLKLCDFRNANLTRTRFFQARGLQFCRLGKTYLAHPQIRQLVVTLNGQSQNFDGLNLEGVNLQDANLPGANLQDASFIGTNLNNANLRNADLARAILKQAQLDGTDMTGAILTGACIEDWGITGSTKLENVQCDYVFMRLETKDNPNRLRKPDNWGETFAEGEFADFIKPYVDTLDLYHSQDIDPRAISIALKNLSTNHPEQELRFVAIERRGNSGLNLRFTTAPGADKSELSREYFRDYARIKKELPAVKLKLVERNAEIRTLNGIIEQFMKAGRHHSKIQAETIQIIKGELVMTQNKGINIRSGGGSIGDISGLVGGDVSGVVNLGAISGSVTNTIDRLPDSSETDEPNIKELLTQLQQAIEDDSDLSDRDKEDLLEQVQALAEAKQTEEPAKKEGLTRKARKMFEATLSSLPQTASIVEACSKLLPMILKGLGLPA
ncbi:pentapeptide repeat-containing protein [Microcoleus sp. MOSTC5]|uniref:pentapeptide repeat-containing protein n=1 Tax=Microcoleus sp. MOSTC5 TaxID=3055378 RepID=UPI002FD1DF0A